MYKHKNTMNDEETQKYKFTIPNANANKKVISYNTPIKALT